MDEPFTNKQQLPVSYPDTALNHPLSAELKRANIPDDAKNPATITIKKINSLVSHYEIPFDIICQNATEIFFEKIPSPLVNGTNTNNLRSTNNTVQSNLTAPSIPQKELPIQATQQSKLFVIPESATEKIKLLEKYIKENNCLALILLVDAGADIRLNPPYRNNAVALAASLGHAFCLRILLIANAPQKNFEPLSRAAPILYAAQKQHFDCLLQLLTCAVDYAEKSKAIVVMINSLYWRELKILKAEQCHQVLAHTKIDLLSAVQNDDDALLKTFLDNDLFTDQLNESFSLAVRLEKMKCLIVLTFEMVDPNVYRDALFDAAKKGNTKIAMCLTKTCLAADRKAALQIAAKHGQIFVIKALLKFSDDLSFIISIILKAAEHSNRQKMEPLFELRDNLDYTVLHLAVRALRYNDAMSLLSAGAKHNTENYADTSIIEDVFNKQRGIYQQGENAAITDLSCINIGTLLIDSGAIIKPTLAVLIMNFITIEQQLNQTMEAQQLHCFIRKMQFYFKCLFDYRHLGKTHQATYLQLIVPCLVQNQITTLQILVEYLEQYVNTNPHKKPHSVRVVDSWRDRSSTPEKRNDSPRKSSASPQLTSMHTPQRINSPLKASDTSSAQVTHRAETPDKRFDSPTPTSQHKADSPTKKSDSPQIKPKSPSERSNSPQQNNNIYDDLISMSLQKGHFECAKLLLEQGISHAIKIKIEHLSLMDSIHELLIAKELGQLLDLLATPELSHPQNPIALPPSSSPSSFKP